MNVQDGPLSVLVCVCWVLVCPSLVIVNGMGSVFSLSVWATFHLVIEASFFRSSGADSVLMGLALFTLKIIGLFLFVSL